MQINAVHVPRHLNIGDHQVDSGPELLQDLERLRGIFRFHALDVVALQDGLEGKRPTNPGLGAGR
jgi:hypothetical protein